MLWEKQKITLLLQWSVLFNYILFTIKIIQKVLRHLYAINET